MDPRIEEKLARQEKVMDEILVSMKKTQRYMLVAMWIGVATVVAPLFGLLFIVPWFLNTYASQLEGLL